MRIYISRFLNEDYAGNQKLIKYWKLYILFPFHLDRNVDGRTFMRILYWCLEW